MSPLDMIRLAGGHIRNVSKTTNGWKLSAPHREDKNPSCSVFRLSNDFPDNDPRAWGVTDFALGWTKRLDKYLKEHFGYEATDDKRESGRRTKPVKQPTLGEKIAARLAGIKDDGQPIDVEPHGEAYKGHGFAELGLDSRKYGVYLIDGKPHIFYRNREGRVFAVKKRTGDPKIKYVWLQGSSQMFWARREGHKSLIVVEGEFKAIALAELFPNADVVGVTSKTLLHKAPIIGYQNVLFVFDPDILANLTSGRLDSLYELMLFGIMNGISIKAFHQSVLNQYVEDASVKDVNDALMAGMEPSEIVQAIRKHARRIRIPERVSTKYMPVFKGLKPSQAHVLGALWPKALSSGRWINQHIVELEASPVELMRWTKLSVPSVYRVLGELIEQGLLKVINGTLGQYSGKKRKIRLNLKKIISKTFLGTSLNPLLFSSCSALNPLTFPMRIANPKHHTPLSSLAYRISALSAARLVMLYGLSYNKARSITGIRIDKIKEVIDFLTGKLAKSPLITLLQERLERWIERYVEQREALISRLRRFMPGTYVRNGRICNPAWNFTLPVSSAFSPELV